MGLLPSCSFNPEGRYIIGLTFGSDHLTGLAIGMCAGAVLGLMFHSVLLGIAIGAALGVAYNNRRNRHQT